MTSSHLRLLNGVLVIIFALFAEVKSVDPVWIHESLDNIPLHPPIDTDYLSWGSTGVFTFSGRKSINVKSVSSPTISKQFSITIPHAELIIQAQFYQYGCFSASEGFQFEVSGVSGTYERFSTSNVVNECQVSSINSFISRFIFPQSDSSFTIYFTSIFDNPNQVDKTISINDFKIALTQCEQSCAKCHLAPSPNLTHSTICDNCPENASFVPNSNLCACNANFVADYSFTYLSCKPNTDVNDNQISAACRAELTNYSARTRVNIFTSEQTINLVPKAIAHIDFFHFYQDITPSCATLIRVSVLKFNSQTNAFESLGLNYIINVVNGEFIEVGFNLEEFASLANVINQEGSKTIYSIRLALQMKVGTTVARVHEFYLIYQLNGDNTHSVSAQNTDYQKNMNFISLSTYNTASFLKEYLFDLKRYFCTNSSCANTRTVINFSKHEQIITKIAFKSTLTKASLVLIDAHLFGNNQTFDIKNSVSILSSGEGYLIVAFYQDFIQTLINNNQATNKVYLQVTVSYHDIPTDPLSKVRYGQVDILFYALYTGII